MAQNISINAIVKAPIEIVWKVWTDPEYIKQWNHASDDWECPSAQNDFRVGGRFVYTMSAKDKSTSFDFSGIYTAIEDYQQISYVMEDGRQVTSTFRDTPDGVNVTVTFDMENENSEEMQRSGWQAILDSFKACAESQV